MGRFSLKGYFMKTNKYELHLQYEVGWDEVPVIRAYQLYLDQNNELSVDTSWVFDRYDYTEADLQWIIKNEKQLDGSPYTELSEFYYDEWWVTDEKHLYEEHLPPKAKDWIAKFSEYEVERV